MTGTEEKSAKVHPQFRNRIVTTVGVLTRMAGTSVLMIVVADLFGFGDAVEEIFSAKEPNYFYWAGWLAFAYFLTRRWSGDDGRTEYLVTRAKLAANSSTMHRTSERP